MCAIAQHFGRPGTPTDQAWIESLFSHVKADWPHLDRITDPAVLRAELASVRDEYNSKRLHAGIGYVTPDDEHEGRGSAIRQARRVGMRRAPPATDRLPPRSTQEANVTAAHTAGSPAARPTATISAARTACQGQPASAEHRQPRSNALDRPPQRSYPYQHQPTARPVRCGLIAGRICGVDSDTPQLDEPRAHQQTSPCRRLTGPSPGSGGRDATVMCGNVEPPVACGRVAPSIWRV